MIAALDLKTGADVVDAIRRCAASRGVKPNVIAGALSPYPTNWLKQMAVAHKPKPETRARVAAVLGGELVPPPTGTNAPTVRQDIDEEARRLGERRYAARSIQTASSQFILVIERPGPVPVLAMANDPRPFAFSREACPRCAVRGDLGCDHQRPFDPEAL